MGENAVDEEVNERSVHFSNAILEPRELSLDHPGKFEYKPLDLDKNEIRFLQLLPASVLQGAGGQTIQCRLVKTSSNDHPDYEALSYTWGSQTKGQRILVNGYDFNVTWNLEEFLIEFRSSTPRTLWVDAI